MDIIKGVALSMILFASAPQKIESVHAEPVVVKTIWQKQELIDYVRNEAIKSSNNPDMAEKIVVCETPWKKGENGFYYDVNDSQSRLTYNEGQIKRNPGWGEVGDRERSYGPWQYHLPAHNLTINEASSVEISTAKAMKDLKTNPKQWTCY